MYFSASPNVGNSALIPVVNAYGPPQNVHTEYIPVAQTSTHIAGVPVESGSHQYIAIRADQLGIPNNRGEVMVSYATAPIHHVSGNMVVQQNTVTLPSGQTIIQDPSQYNTFTSNVINSSVPGTNISSSPVSSNMVPVNTAQLNCNNVNVQHVSQMPMQTGGQQQFVRVVPGTQTQPVINSVTSFANTSSETSPSGSSNAQINNKGKIWLSFNLVKFF